MKNSILANLFENDIRRLIEEINLFRNEENLWKVAGSVKNSCGNLVLHIIGGMNYLVGSVLAHTGYIRNREEEFKMKGLEKKILLSQLEDLIRMINLTLVSLDQKQLEAEYPILFDDMRKPTIHVLLQLSGHINYHLGQVNYLRRILENSTD